MSAIPRTPCIGFVALVGLFFAAEGCEKPQTANEALTAQLKNNPQVVVSQTAKFAGQISVDGQPAPKGTRFIILLSDPKSPYDPVSKQRPLATSANAEGRFSFTTYMKDDGVPPGKYVVAIAALHPVGFNGRNGYGPPDELKNLYNDPAANAKDPVFNIEIAPPGKTDWEFELKTAGKQPATAGTNSFTKLYWGH